MEFPVKFSLLLVFAIASSSALKFTCHEYISEANEDAIACPVYDTSVIPPRVIDRVPKMPCLLIDCVPSPNEVGVEAEEAQRSRASDPQVPGAVRDMAVEVPLHAAEEGVEVEEEENEGGADAGLLVAEQDHRDQDGAEEETEKDDSDDEDEDDYDEDDYNSSESESESGDDDDAPAAHTNDDSSSSYDDDEDYGDEDVLNDGDSDEDEDDDDDDDDGDADSSKSKAGKLRRQKGDDNKSGNNMTISGTSSGSNKSSSSNSGNKKKTSLSNNRPDSPSSKTNNSSNNDNSGNNKTNSSNNGTSSDKTNSKSSIFWAVIGGFVGAAVLFLLVGLVCLRHFQKREVFLLRLVNEQPPPLEAWKAREEELMKRYLKMKEERCVMNTMDAFTSASRLQAQKTAAAWSQLHSRPLSAPPAIAPAATPFPFDPPPATRRGDKPPAALPSSVEAAHAPAEGRGRLVSAPTASPSPPPPTPAASNKTVVTVEVHAAPVGPHFPPPLAVLAAGALQEGGEVHQQRLHRPRVSRRGALSPVPEENETELGEITTDAGSTSLPAPALRPRLQRPKSPPPRPPYPRLVTSDPGPDVIETSGSSSPDNVRGVLSDGDQPRSRPGLAKKLSPFRLGQKVGKVFKGMGRGDTEKKEKEMNISSSSSSTLPNSSSYSSSVETVHLSHVPPSPAPMPTFPANVSPPSVVTVSSPGEASNVIAVMRNLTKQMDERKGGKDATTTAAATTARTTLTAASTITTTTAPPASNVGSESAVAAAVTTTTGATATTAVTAAATTTTTAAAAAAAGDRGRKKRSKTVLNPYHGFLRSAVRGTSTNTSANLALAALSSGTVTPTTSSSMNLRPRTRSKSYAEGSRKK